MDYQFARIFVSFLLRRNKAGVFSAVEIPYFPVVLRQTQAPLRGPTLRHPSGTFQSAEGPKVFETEKMMGISDDK